MRKTEQTTESGRIYGGESAAERLARQRQQFMDAGLELFGSVGYRNSTVRLLCKEAGLIDRYFYKTFTDTEDLLAAIYTASLNDIEARVQQAVSAQVGKVAPVAVIEAGLDAFFAAFENSRVARICWLEVMGVNARIDALYTGRIQQFADYLLQLARSLLPQWPLTDEEARISGIALIGAISQSAMHWLLEDYRTPRTVLVKANSRIIRGLLTELSKP